jgi:hypothetical protein
MKFEAATAITSNNRTRYSPARRIGAASVSGSMRVAFCAHDDSKSNYKGMHALL